LSPSRLQCLRGYSQAKMICSNSGPIGWCIATFADATQSEREIPCSNGRDGFVSARANAKGRRNFASLGSLFR
jgi:hypothetical protein